MKNEVLEISVSAHKDRQVRDRPPEAIGNGGGDWNASQTSLRLAVGLQRESVMENSQSPSRLLFFLQCREFRLVKRGYRTREDKLQLAVQRIHNWQRSFVSSLQLPADGGVSCTSHKAHQY